MIQHASRRRVQGLVVCPSFKLWAVGAILFSLMAHALPAGAQKSPVPPDMFRPSPDKRVISSQLRMALSRARTTLAGLEVASHDESVPLDPDMIQAARDTYSLIAAAKNSMGFRIGSQKFPDPVAQLNFKHLEEAWNAARYTQERAASGYVAREEYLTNSVHSMSRALQLVNQVLMLL